MGSMWAPSVALLRLQLATYTSAIKTYQSTLQFQFPRNQKGAEK